MITFNQFIQEEMYPAKQKPIRYKDIEVDIIKMNGNIRLVKHGTTQDLDWRIVGILDDEKAEFINNILYDVERGNDIIPVKVDSVKRKGYMLHVIDIRDEKADV